MPPPPSSQPVIVRPLVTEQDVQAAPVGSQLSIPQGALVTPLARQVALERCVTLKEGERAVAPASTPVDEPWAEIARIGRLMHEKGFVVATDGNISMRLGPDRLLSTPSGLHKGFLQPQDLIVTDMDGVKVRSASPEGCNLRPTSEMPMHLEVYRQRPDVGAVVHAHPPTAIALSIAGVSLAEYLLPEVVITLGLVPTTEYATPSGQETARAVKDLIREHDGIVLKSHGVLTVGANPFDAYMKLETIEHYAGILLTLRQLGRYKPLPPDQVDKLLAMRRQMGFDRHPG